MTAIQPYTVPLITGDLRRAEMVKQCADVFEYMDLVSQDMFNRIAIRLNLYRAQLNKFDERIQHAHSNIERIKGSNRAIQVHSSARYPVEQTRSTYKSIFEHESDSEEYKPPILHYNSFRLNETVDKFIDPMDKGSKSNDESLVILKQYEPNFIQKTKRNVLVGLGKPPANIKSVISFLKYNTQENPYTQPTKIDPLSVGSRRKQAVEPTQPRISEAPAPAFYKQITEHPNVAGISYNPLLGLVPELALPDNLPELNNFATFDDNAGMEWIKQQTGSIAPSYVMSMLPDLNDLSSTSTATAAPVEPAKPAAPAPPPVDIPAIIPLTSAANTAPPPAPATAPPPAPPLPPTLPPPLPSSANTDESQPSIDNPLPLRSGGGGDDDDDGGNPLLAEIRNFGKKKQLKSTAKSDPLDTPAVPAPKGGGNIMDSLIERLQKRRNFITGENAASSSAAEKTIAAPTPPPLPSTGGTFTDAIAAKAKQIADEKQMQKDDSDNDSESDDNWE